MEKIKPFCKDENIVLTVHVRERMKKRGVWYSDMVAAVANGEIIERYEDDSPYPSCLILGHATSNLPLHVVIGIGDDKLWVITTYYPTLDKWEDGFRIRKAVK
jgi:hypothetical protein